MSDRPSLYLRYVGKFVKVVWTAPDVETGKEIPRWIKGYCVGVAGGKVQIEASKDGNPFTIEEDHIIEMNEKNPPEAGRWKNETDIL